MFALFLASLAAIGYDFNPTVVFGHLNTDNFCACVEASYLRPMERVKIDHEKRRN